MTSGQLIKKYYQGVDDLKVQKTLLRRIVMESIKSEIEIQVGQFGWKVTGKHGVTESMVNSNIFKMDYFKDFNGEKVVIIISINLGDDYQETGYNQIIIKGSKLIPDKGWWVNSKGNGSHFDFITGVNNHVKFNLNSQLQLINDTYLG